MKEGKSRYLIGASRVWNFWGITGNAFLLDEGVR